MADFLLPGESITWELEVAAGELGRFEFSVRLAFSVRSFFTYRRDLPDSPELGRAAVVRAIRLFNEVPIHDPVDLVFDALATVRRDAALPNVARLRGTIDIALEKLPPVYNSLGVPFGTPARQSIREHFERVGEYLGEVGRQLNELKKAAAGKDPAAMTSVADGINTLRAGSLELDKATSTLIRRLGLTEAETAFRYAERR